MSARSVDRCVASRRWIRVYSATYLMAGSPRTWKQALLAATLSVPGAAASHRSAGALWGCPGIEPGSIEISVTRRARRKSFKVHETKSLGSHEIRRREGIPLTDPERTLVDLGSSVGGEALEAALDHLLSSRLTTLERIERRLLEMNGSGWRGTKRLRALVRDRDPGDGNAESRLETKLFRTLRDAKIRLPLRQVEIYNGDRFLGRVDVAYPDRRLIIEAQSYAHHSSKKAWTSDIRRRRELAVLGWRVVEVTWYDLTIGKEKFVRDLRELLGEISFAI